MKNNIIQFEEFKQQLKLKRKVKYKKYRHKYYVAIPRIKYRSVQGFHSSKKEFLKETIEIFKQLLNEHNAEFFFCLWFCLFHKLSHSLSVYLFDLKNLSLSIL